MIVKIHWYPLNGYDNLNIVVDKFSDKVILDKEKWLNENERLYVKIYDDGHAVYGAELQKDPWHGNQKYTWSSNSSDINKAFDLIGTPLQLAASNVGIRELENQYSCYFSCGYLLDNILKIAMANEDSLTKPFNIFYRREARRDFAAIKPRKGLKLGKRHIDVLNTRWIETNEGWLDVHECSDYILKKTGCWCLGDWLNKELV